jgi:hypothetical protein
MGHFYTERWYVMDDDDIQDYMTNKHEDYIRNKTLEEVAQEIEKMTAFGQDTIASFAVHIRNMKREWFR